MPEVAGEHATLVRIARSKLRLLLWLAAPPAFGLALFLFFIMRFEILPFEQLGKPSVVVSGKLACGEFMLTQTCTGTPDPCLIWFYFRPLRNA